MLNRPVVNAALGAALSASLVTLAGTLLLTNQRGIDFTIPPVDMFLTALELAALPVLIYLVVMVVAGMLGWMRVWWQGLLAGALGVLLGAVISYAVRIASLGMPLNGEAWKVVFAELLGLSFPFVVSGLLCGAFVAPMVFRSLAGVGASQRTARAVGDVGAPVSTSQAGSAFVRIPSQAMLDAATDDDARTALNEQWEAMVEAFEEHEWGTQAIDEAASAELSTFVGDTALVIGEQVVLARPKSDERRAEIAQVREALDTAGAVFDELEAPALFDPADVVVTDNTVFVGVGAATNTSAVRQLRRMVTPRGYRLVAVPVKAGMHLSEVCSTLPDGAVLAWTAALERPEALGAHIAVPEARGAATVTLDEYTVAVSAAAPETAELIGSLGYDVVELDLSAFEGVGGSLPRLSLRSRD